MISRALAQRPNIRLLVLLTITAAVFIVQCAKNPVTGKREFMLMSESQEIALGAQSDPAIVAQYGLVEDQELAAYIDSLGQAMVAVSHRPDLKFTFRLLDDPIVNAFALPGGYVYITRGIMAYLGDEAGLAGVVGHEIGHVTARHGAQRYTEQQLYGLGLGLGSVFSETFAQYAGVAAQATQLLLLKYGRDDERQSDRLGVEYATKIGYDTEEMANFFRTLDRLTEAAGGSGLPSWASTHPDPGERYETVLALTSDWQTRIGDPDYRRNRESYIRRLENLVFGQNPRHGYVDEGYFLHPDLEFRFPVPTDWVMQNTPSQVLMGSPDQQALIIFMLDSEAGTPLAAQQTFITETQGTLIERRQFKVGGYQAVRAITDLQQQSGILRVYSWWIEKDDLIYVFHGLGNQPTTFTTVAEGFGRLTDPEALNIQPVVVHIIRSERGGPFEQVVAAHPIPEGSETDLDGLALLNGFASPDAMVEPGSLVKVLRRRPQ